jgi:hypothetical protein
VKKMMFGEKKPVEVEYREMLEITATLAKDLLPQERTERFSYIDHTTQNKCNRVSNALCEGEEQPTKKRKRKPKRKPRVRRKESRAQKEQRIRVEAQQGSKVFFLIFRNYV